MMKPILFNTDMVRAILDGRKTVTRRVVKPQPKGRLAFCSMGYKAGTWSYPGDTAYKFWGEEWRVPEGLTEEERMRHWKAPCNTDDILWARETWAHVKFGQGELHYEYRADCIDPHRWSNGSFAEWRRSIHMPREAARVFLRVTDVRVERLQEIDGNGLRAEGFDIPCLPNEVEDQFNKYGAIFDLEQAKKSFSALWDSTIKPADRDRYGWAANPWVWVIAFERSSKPEEVHRCWNLQ